MASYHVTIALLAMVAPAACANILGFEEGVFDPNASVPGESVGGWPPGQGGAPGTGAQYTAGGWTAPNGTAGSVACVSEAPDSSGCDLRPPPYVNVDVCAGIVDSPTNPQSANCITCCYDNGKYSDSSFIHNNQCTCADMPTYRDTVTCADQFADKDTCGNCCQAVGYARWSWNSSLCTCVGQLDNATICADTVNLAKPAEACPNCCINNGYLGVNYFALGRQCTCTT
jgi:hypothetical protein